MSRVFVGNASSEDSVESAHLHKLDKITFCGFSMGSNQCWAGRVYDMCVYFMTWTPEGSTESDFVEKPGIEPAIPGLQDIGLSPTSRRLHKLVVALR